MTVKDLRTLVDNLDEYIHVPGGIERLKKTILHLAVSGQLVPQNPSEGTGQELYGQIQSEKQKLIAEGNLKKQKPLPKIAEGEAPFVIPKSWKWVRLGSVLVVSSSKRIHMSDYVSDGIPFYRSKEIGDLKKGKLVKTELFISNEKFNGIKEKFGSPVKGDIFITSVGTIGNVWISDGREFYYKDGNITQISQSQYYLPEFLEVYINSDLFKNQALRTVSGTAYTALTIVKLNKLLMPQLPTLEQQRIVDRVATCFNLTDRLERKFKVEQEERRKLVVTSLSKLSQGESAFALGMLTDIIKTKRDAAELRKTILHLAVSGQLVPQDPSEGTGEELYCQIQADKQKLIAEGKLRRQKPLIKIAEVEIPFEIPENWKWVRLGDVSDIFNGNSINANEKSSKFSNVSEGFPYIATKDIGYGFEEIEYENGVKIPRNESKYKIISTGTVLICSEGGSAGKKCGIIDRDVTFGNKMYAFKAFDESILADFVLFHYLTKSFYEQFRNKMTGIIGGISIANFKELVIPLPPLAEQTRIVNKTTQLLNLIDKLEQHLEE